jgi:hypothetical protein
MFGWKGYDVFSSPPLDGPPAARHGRYAPVRMIKLTEARAITPYKWVHPDEER